MKKLIAFVLCIVLAAGCAVAEEQSVGCPAAEKTQRTSVYQIEGMSEEVTETLFAGAAGYEIWYPDEYLEAGLQYGHDCFRPVGAGEDSDIYFMIVPADANPADAEGLLSEAVGGFGPEATIDDMELSESDGILIGRVGVIDGNTVYRYYLISDRQNMLLITACFPAEAAEGFGVRFDRMAETITFTGLQLTGRHEGEGYAMAYPEGVIEVGSIYSHDAFIPAGSGEEPEASLMIVRSDIASEHADALLDEAVGGYENADEAVRGEEKELAGGLTLNWIQIEQEGRIDRFYLIRGEDSVYCLTSSFPAVSEVDYGAVFDAMAESFELIEAE